MIPFTDEDLKKLKDELDANGEIYDCVLPALVGRLEAAEKVVACHILLEREMINYDSFVVNLQAWHKTKGD